MLFTEPSFLFLFLPVLLALYFLKRRPGEYANVLLLGRERAVLRAAAGGAFTWLMLASIAFNYGMAIAVAAGLRGPPYKHARSRRWLAVAIGVNLAVLGVFKYANFFADNVNALLAGLSVAPFAVPEVLLPIGISFYAVPGHAIHRRRGLQLAVQHLLETREFLFPELVGNPIATQVLWGALFCLPFGFSLSRPARSTWVLGVLAVCALYLLVRECGGTRRSALMAAAVLGFYPVFFILSPTFMTDVPFLAAMLWSVLLFVRALHRRRVALVWLAAAVCAASVGSRSIGVGVAGAMIATLLFHTGRWGRRIHVCVGAGARRAVRGVVAGVDPRARLYVGGHHVAAEWPAATAGQLRYAFGADIFPPMLVVTVLSALVLVGIALLPLAVGLARRAIVRRMAYVLALFAAAWVIAKRAGLNAWIPFEPGYIWALREIGARASFVPGWQADPLPWWVAASAVAVALASAAILVAAWPPGSLREAEKFLVWNIAAPGVLVAVLAQADRYALVFVPPAAALVLARTAAPAQRTDRRVHRPYAAIALAGAHDHLDYNRAVWSAVADLRAGGVPPRDIDGGYVVKAGCNISIQRTRTAMRPGRIIVPMVTDSCGTRPGRSSQIGRCQSGDCYVYVPLPPAGVRSSGRISGGRAAESGGLELVLMSGAEPLALARGPQFVPKRAPTGEGGGSPGGRELRARTGPPVCVTAIPVRRASPAGRQVPDEIHDHRDRGRGTWLPSRSISAARCFSGRRIHPRTGRHGRGRHRDLPDRQPSLVQLRRVAESDQRVTGAVN